MYMTTKNTLFKSIAISIALVSLFSAAAVYAVVPTLSLVTTTGDSVQVTVNGDSNATVMFYYNVGSTGGMQVRTLGTTNSSGYFSMTISSSAYGVNSGNSVYAIVNGQQSSLQAWPYTSAASTPVLSRNNVTVGLGQQTTVYSQTSTNIYMSSNSNPSVASSFASGVQITVTGNQIGSTNMNICYAGSASNCATLTVNVQSTPVSTLSLSQTNISLNNGSNQTITVSGGGGTYSVSGNTNTSVVSTSLSGNVLTVYGNAVGNSTISICDQSGNCGSLYVNVGSTTGGGSITFSQTSPTLSLGQVIYVNIYGGSGYYVSSNNDSSIASQSISGSTLTVTALNNGVTTMTVCSQSNGCGSITVTVNTAGTSGSVSFGVTNPVIIVGQTMNVSLSGGSSYYISSNSNSNIIQASVNGNSLSLYASSVGSDSISVCASGGGCNTIYATVNTTGTTTTTTTTGTVASSVIIAQIQALQSVIATLVAQIQSVSTQLSTLLSQVNAGTAPGVTSSAGGSTTTASYKFYSFLSVGSQGGEVTALQQLLIKDGYYSGSATGYFGTATEAAVKAYQKAHGIDQAGYVGPSTRTFLNNE